MRVVNITKSNAKAAIGEEFFANHTFLAVANGATVYMRHISGAKYMHSVVHLTTVGEWTFNSYAGTTYTDDGTEVTPINRKSDSAVVAGTTFYHTPTIDVLGTGRLSFVFGAGTNPAQAESGAFTEPIESVFAPGLDVLVGLTNNSGFEQYISFRYDFHEEEG